MPKTRRPRRLVDAYAFRGFRPGARVRGSFGDPLARIVTLARRAKKRAAGLAERCIAASTTARAGGGPKCRAGTVPRTYSSTRGRATCDAAVRWNEPGRRVRA